MNGVSFRILTLGLWLVLACAVHAQYNVTILNGGFYESVGKGVAGESVVGGGRSQIDKPFRATLWSGPGYAPTDLTPTGYNESMATAAWGAYQAAAFRALEEPYYSHAALWHDSPNSYIDLAPPWATQSWGFAMAGKFQVGVAWAQASRIVL